MTSAIPVQCSQAKWELVIFRVQYCLLDDFLQQPVIIYEPHCIFIQTEPLINIREHCDCQLYQVLLCQ